MSEVMRRPGEAYQDWVERSHAEADPDEIQKLWEREDAMREWCLKQRKAPWDRMTRHPLVAERTVDYSELRFPRHAPPTPGTVCPICKRVA